MSKLAAFKSAVQENANKNKGSSAARKPAPPQQAPTPSPLPPPPPPVVSKPAAVPEAWDGDGCIEPEDLQGEALAAALRRSMTEIRSTDPAVALLGATRIRKIISRG
jgi:hypothetical protein